MLSRRTAVDSLGAAITKHVAAIESDGGVERFAGFDFGAFKPDTTIVDTVRSRLAAERAQHSRA